MRIDIELNNAITQNGPEAENSGAFCVARKREDPGLTADRSSMWILIAMEEVLIMATAGAGRL